MNTSLNPIQRVGVAGAGAWGTALAVTAAEAGRDVVLWAREPKVAESINRDRENRLFLPGIQLPPLKATSVLTDLADCQMLLMVVPTQFMAKTLRMLAPDLPAGMPVVLCSKGIEQGTLHLTTDILEAEAPEAKATVLSGPSFAADVAAGLPTAVTLAAKDPALGARLVTAIGQPTFRPYLSDDLIGAQIGGAVKNVLAIACGIVEGKKFGPSARAALTARGFTEMTRLAVAMGAKQETLSGLSGLGDLILTCNSTNSRNMSLGKALGEGEALSDILASRNSIAEGYYTASAVRSLAQKYGIEMPICDAVAEIADQTKSVDQAITDLLNRPFKQEGL